MREKILTSMETDLPNPEYLIKSIAEQGYSLLTPPEPEQIEKAASYTDLLGQPRRKK